MLKKLMLLALSVGALVAFAAQAAQANVELTGAEKGDEITATANNSLITTFATGFVMDCENVTLHLEVLTNGPEHVELEQIGAATTTNCQINLGPGGKVPATITDGTLGVGEGSQITINTWGLGTTNATFGSDIPKLGIACHLAGAFHVKATDGTDILDLVPSTLTGSGSAGCGNATFEGSFTLEKGSNPVTVDAVNTL